jgi:hypothetical protein
MSVGSQGPRTGKGAAFLAPAVQIPARWLHIRHPRSNASTIFAWFHGGKPSRIRPTKGFYEARQTLNTQQNAEPEPIRRLRLNVLSRKTIKRAANASEYLKAGKQAGHGILRRRLLESARPDFQGPTRALRLPSSTSGSGSKMLTCSGQPKPGFYSASCMSNVPIVHGEVSWRSETARQYGRRGSCRAGAILETDAGRLPAQD